MSLSFISSDRVVCDEACFGLDNLRDAEVLGVGHKESLGKAYLSEINVFHPCRECFVKTDAGISLNQKSIFRASFHKV